MSTPVPGEDDRLSVRAALANESMESVLSIWSSTLPCRMLHSSAPWVACALASSIAFAAKAAGQLACVSSRGRCFYRQKGRCFSAPSFERLRDVSCCKVDPAPKFPAGFPSSREAFPANLAGNSTTRWLCLIGSVDRPEPAAALGEAGSPAWRHKSTPTQCIATICERREATIRGPEVGRS